MRDKLEQRALVSNERDIEQRALNERDEQGEGMNDLTLFYNKLYTKNIFLIKK